MENETDESLKPKGRGGPGRGQGRKPSTEISLNPTAIRLTEPQRRKLKLLGGSVWVREQIEKAPAPPGLYPTVRHIPPDPDDPYRPF